MKKRTIVIIDDELDFCRILKRNLEELLGFDVFICINGDQGVKLVKRLIPDLVLLDIAMPGMNGFDVLQRMRSHHATMDIPVVMISALADARSIEKIAQLHNGAYLSKPVEILELQSKISKVLKEEPIEKIKL
ncbi:MAG: response regulator [Candidatus Omnitrophica bacterium]|nr:response regulator [Candidatus Omnitrophota bacterium]